MGTGLGWDGSAMEIWAVFGQTGRCQAVWAEALGEGHRDIRSELSPAPVFPQALGSPGMRALLFS